MDLIKALGFSTADSSRRQRIVAELRGVTRGLLLECDLRRPALATHRVARSQRLYMVAVYEVAPFDAPYRAAYNDDSRPGPAGAVGRTNASGEAT